MGLERGKRCSLLKIIIVYKFELHEFKWNFSDIFRGLTLRFFSLESNINVDYILLSSNS